MGELDASSIKADDIKTPVVIPAMSGIIPKKDSGVTKNKEKIMPEIEKKKYPRLKCEAEGCQKQAWKDHCCMVHYKEKHGIPRKVKKDIAVPEKKAKRAYTKRKTVAPVIPKPSEFCKLKEEPPIPADFGNATYIIPVDFSKYPNLHQKLLTLATEDFRDPGQQLLSMIHNTLKDAEART